MSLSERTRRGRPGGKRVWQRGRVGARLLQCGTGDGQGAEAESDAKTHLRVRYMTPFEALRGHPGDERVE